MFEPLVDSTHNPQVSSGLNSALTAAALGRLENTAWLRVIGEDRVRWLNGMSTNSVQALKPGQGCYTFFLNAQGKIQGDAMLWMVEDQALLLETAADRLPALTQFLDRFIIMDDVELKPLAPATGLVVVGPQAAARLRELVPLPATASGWLEHEGLRILAVAGGDNPRFELWGSSVQLADVTARLALPLLSPADLDALRILDGTPLYGIDIREKELPQETAPAGGQSRALHFSKGCYLGQEIVERIHSRGNVHRVFSGFLLTGERPAAGTVLTDPENPEKALGELTSIIRLGAQMFALGYIRREALERKLALSYPGGAAQPATLPFSLPPAETR